MQNNIKLHPLLIKQLEKAGVNKKDTVIEKATFDSLMGKISQKYYETEQDRYLLERSIEISSREMGELNNKLEFAQAIAQLGYWSYNRREEKIIWSKQTYQIFGLSISNVSPQYDFIMSSIAESDRKQLETLINAAFEEGKEYETEFRIKRFSDGEERWLYAKGMPNYVIDNNGIKSTAIDSIAGIVIDITNRKKAERELAELHGQLVEYARRAGMSEVATSVLHNIGNILTSIIISIYIVKENSNYDNLVKLNEISKMIQENYKKADYFTADDKGKLIPDYLVSLSGKLLENSKKKNTELEEIDQHITHIKDIISIQNNIAGVAGVTEKIALTEIVDSALVMSIANPDEKGIQISKDYQYHDIATLDKTKLLQVLVNLIKNAKDSLISSGIKDKKIILSVMCLKEENMAVITIKDNGVGIPEDKLVKIFSLGYTTKKSGHGFGLHSAAIAIKELGGTLNVESEGVGKGATFIIKLPIVN